MFPDIFKQYNLYFYFQLNSLGDLLDLELTKQRKEENCFKNTSKLLDVGNEELVKLNFVIISFSTYCRTGNESYIPAEVGLTAFSLQNGVMDYYSSLMDRCKL